MRISVVVKVLVATVALTVVADAVAAQRKIIRACGWDLAHVTVADIHRNRAKFAGLGVDGVHLVPLGIWPDGTPMRECETSLSVRPWRGADFSKLVPLLRDITATEGLRDSAFRVQWCPHKRVDWQDDSAWATVAENMTCLAELAYAVGIKGFAFDEEDYYDARQFLRIAGDPPYREMARIARRRGREVFTAVFKAHPNLEISSSWGFSTILKWPEWLAPAANDDQTGTLESYGELWPCFLNGIIEAMPPTARFYEGNEAKGYHGVATRRDFEVGAWETSRGVLPQLGKELRGKYLQRLSVSFGQYIDMYVNPAPPKGKAFYYFPPKYGSRLKAFEENLVSALAVADHMIWIYGEKGRWIDWDLGGKVNDDRSFKYPTWEEQLPGFSRMLRLAKGDFEPLEKDIAAGRATNLVSNSACESFGGRLPKPFGTWTGTTNAIETLLAYDSVEGAESPGCLKQLGKGCYTWTTPNLRPGDELFVKVRVKGCNPRVILNWKCDGTNLWDRVYSTLVLPIGCDHGRWTELRKRLIVPEYADGLGVVLGGAVEESAANWFDDVRVYLIPRPE